MKTKCSRCKKKPVVGKKMCLKHLKLDRDRGNFKYYKKVKLSE